jgi:anti-sigma-K factor RskA
MDLHRHPELLDRLAASYALGTLRGGARRRFEAQARTSPTVRQAGLLWQQRLGAMTELQPPQAPSDNVWKRIALALDAERTADAATGSRPHPAEALLAGLRRRLAFWRGTAWAGIAATALVAVVGVQLWREVGQREAQLAQLRTQPLVEYVAVLAGEGSDAQVLVTFDPRQQRLTLKRVGAIDEGADRSLQLWALAPGGTPRSLGVLEQRQPVVRFAADQAAVSGVPALAISLEPRGGAPVGSGPTGPVLYKGALLQAPL